LPADLGELARALAALGVARLHYHHVQGMPQSILVDLMAPLIPTRDVSLSDPECTIFVTLMLRG